MIWISDLALLDPLYLKQQFRPWENGITPEIMALSMLSLDTTVREYVLSHIDDCFSTAVKGILQNVKHASPEKIHEAQTIVVKSYLWELVYWKYPVAYEMFSSRQNFPFEQLFPQSVLARRSVLDIGCGSGKLTAHIARYARQTLAMDPSVPLLEICKKRFDRNMNVSVIRGSFADIAIANESVDLIVSCLAFQTTEERGGMSGLNSMRRVLRKGGQMRMIVGTEATQRFLLEQGFKEEFYAAPVTWHANEAEILKDANSLVVKMLQDITCGASREGLDTLFQSTDWRWRRILVGLQRVIGGGQMKDIFRGGKLKHPIGVPIFIWTKSVTEESLPLT